MEERERGDDDGGTNTRETNPLYFRVVMDGCERWQARHASPPSLVSIDHTLEKSFICHHLFILSSPSIGLADAKGERGAGGGGKRGRGAGYEDSGGGRAGMW